MGAGAPQTLDFAIHGPILRSDLPGLCDRVCAVMHKGAQILHCDVRSVPSNAVTVDALARLQLAARRNGCKVRLRNASGELLDLVRLMGLADVIAD